MLKLDSARWQLVGLELYFEDGAYAYAYVLPRLRDASLDPDTAIRMEMRLGEDGAPSLMDVIAGFDRLNIVLTDRPQLKVGGEMVWDAGSWVSRG